MEVGFSGGILLLCTRKLHLFSRFMQTLSVENLILDFPQQLKRGIEIAKKIRFTPPSHEIRNVVIAGMGGSGIGGNLVESFVSDEIKVPVTILKGYELPAFVNSHTLFIASSFSGNTEETLATLELAFSREAQVACITAGGKLLQLADEKQLTLALLPNEAPSPRAFLGYSFIQLMYLLRDYQLISDHFEPPLQESIWMLEGYQEDIQKKARKIAAELEGKLPVLYGDTKFLPVLTRFQQQINENSKQLAHVNVFPEMNHNELVGFLKPETIWKDTVVLMLRTAYDQPRVSIRMDVCEPIFRKIASKILTVNAFGDSHIEQAVYLIHLFDWVSLYLAGLNSVDAFIIENIDHLKNELAKR
jgi:glucose/mannose-6-phosphate isomerase